MSALKPAYSYWDFSKTVRTKQRWVLTGKAKQFLVSVAAAATTRARSLKPGVRLYRAQVGSDSIVHDEDVGVEEEIPLSESRMLPDAKFTKNGGRANPPGFPYLYLATTAETALAEMRPWVGESITLATFEIQRRLKLVLCQAGPENGAALTLALGQKPPRKQAAHCLWNDISRAFARPVNREDQESAYVPTQVLADLFKAEGFDGIAYRSGLERGTNVVIFEPSAAKPCERFVYALKRVRYDFEAVSCYGIYRQNKQTGNGTCLSELYTESP